MVRITLSTQGWTIAEAATPDQTVDLAHRDPPRHPRRAAGRADPRPIAHRRGHRHARAAGRSARATAFLRGPRAPAPAGRGARDHASDQPGGAGEGARSAKEGREVLGFDGMSRT